MYWDEAYIYIQEHRLAFKLCKWECSVTIPFPVSAVFFLLYDNNYSEFKKKKFATYQKFNTLWYSFQLAVDFCVAAKWSYQ